MRPNFFVNTPDILHAYLQYGGPAAFKVRAVLASMLSPAWGVYAGYELYEHVPVRQGSEEYLDSEKYQLRPRDWNRPDSLAPYLTMLNRVRRRTPGAALAAQPAACTGRTTRKIMAFSKATGADAVLVVVNLDPHASPGGDPAAGHAHAGVRLARRDGGLRRGDRAERSGGASGPTFAWTPGTSRRTSCRSGAVDRAGGGRAESRWRPATARHCPDDHLGSTRPSVQATGTAQRMIDFYSRLL